MLEVAEDSQQSAVSAIAGGLVVSCQAPIESPLRESGITAKFGRAAMLGGAVGLRVNGPDDVIAVRAITSAPIIGLHKIAGPRRNMITPTVEFAVGLAEAGADIIALDLTVEAVGDTLSLLHEVKATTGLPVMADISTLAEGLRAWDSGADIVGTTLSGYTPESGPAGDVPDITLVEQLANRGVRVVAEGRYHAPVEVRAAFLAGAFAVVVGGAITDPLSTTRRFSAAAPARSVA
ncbi:N-acetylmannosamine-6-phosphate 2-epimerase [Microbacterium sp. zg.Y909]|uniref:N-acetylmannosamine-6-phosphate 2-epimerase n=1 Tax=Microbacterium sp. zg.Y909 TaxID=2969413 RepID=UPI00214B2AC7|nr:putative N-acetylmannosamine-6-phosphate 2-epimerase [Microbacterium sp. zg.Y909]MCR2824964.1 putative N-acetylmannosamine-6-phosphate 2-epimerase [Microbacterium sp. zg.Y909]